MAEAQQTPNKAEASAPASTNTRALGVEVGTTTATNLKSYVDIPSAHEVEAAAAEARVAEQVPAESPKAPPVEDAKAPEDNNQVEAESSDADADSSEYDFEAGPPEAFDYNFYSAKIDAKGELGEADYEAIQKQLPGVTKDMIDDHIAMVRDQNAAHEKRWSDALGGSEESKQAHLQWARENYSPAEMATYNKIMAGRDIAAIDMAVRDLASRYSAANPEREPKVQLGQANRQATPTSSGGYESMAAWQKDRRSPQFKTDPAFREQVARRLAATPRAIRDQQAQR